MWQIVIVTLVHTSILFVVLFGLRRLDRYTSYKFSRFDVHCPTKLAGKGQYEAPPQGQALLWLVIHLIIPRLILSSAIIGLRGNALWTGGKWEVIISELRESSMVVRITLSASNPEIAFELKSYVQEHIVDYLNQFKRGSLIGAVADQKSPKAAPEPIKNQKLEPAASTCGAA